MRRLIFPPKQVLKENRSWLLMAVLVFSAGLAFFFFSDRSGGMLDAVIGSQFEQLQQLFGEIAEIPAVVASALIFMNNFLSMAQMLLLGFLAGLSPLVTLFLNGAMVGAVARLLHQEGLPLWSFLAVGLLPHGVFELTAFFICGAMGLKLGYHCVASPLPGKTRGESFRYIWKETVSVIPLVALLLAVAAVIEIYFTQTLMLRFF